MRVVVWTLPGLLANGVPVLIPLLYDAYYQSVMSDAFAISTNDFVRYARNGQSGLVQFALLSTPLFCSLVPKLPASRGSFRTQFFN